MTKSLIVTATLAALLAACSSAPTAPVEEKAPAQTAEAKKAEPKKAAAKPKKVDPYKAADALDKIPLLQKRSVYFEYDQYEISLDYVSVIEAHAKYMKYHDTARVTVEGNADERGSREYNLALGQKRAEAVKSSLQMMGVKNEAALEAVSFGEEKPKATGSNEEAWAENRRADIVYKAK